MKSKHFFGHKPNAIIKVSLISLCLLSFLTLKAQIPTDFSGRWEYDKDNSDKQNSGAETFNGTIVLEIIQNSSTISFSLTYSRPGMDDFHGEPESFLMNGKVTTYKSGTDPAKKFIKWSQDMKNLTTNMITTVTLDDVAQDFLVANTYKLSDDGETLMNEEFRKSKLNGEKTIKKVYKKKV